MQLPLILFNSMIINHATFLWHFCTNSIYIDFQKIYYKKKLILWFHEHDISNVPPFNERILGILELDRGDSAPYIFDRKNRVYVPPL